MARTRMKTTEGAGGELDRASEKKIPTGGNPPTDENILGDVPKWGKNLVVVVSPRAVIERVDSENWAAKFLGTTATRPGAKNAGALRWDTVGYYASPGYAAKRVIRMLVTGDCGDTIGLEELANRIERIMATVTPRIIAGERVHAFDEAAKLVSSKDDAEKLRARARAYGGGAL